VSAVKLSEQAELGAGQSRGRNQGVIQPRSLACHPAEPQAGAARHLANIHAADHRSVTRLVA